MSDGVLERIADALENLVMLGRRALRPPQPGHPFLRVTGELNDMLLYKLVLPPKSASDVTKRTLTVNGVERELPGDAMEADGYSGNDNEIVSVRLIDIDDALIPSVPRDATFTLIDNQAPPQPGEIGLVVTGET